MSATLLATFFLNLILTVLAVPLRSKNALVIVDVQQCYIENGSLEIKAKHIIPVIERIRKERSCLFDAVFLIQDFHPPQHISFAETHGLLPFSHMSAKGGLPAMCLPDEAHHLMEKSSCCPTQILAQKFPNRYNVSCDKQLCPPRGFEWDDAWVKGSPACIKCGQTPQRCFKTEMDIWPQHCLQSGDSAFAPGLTVLDTDIIIQKGQGRYVDAYSVFFDKEQILKTELEEKLQEREIDTLFVTGLSSSECVKWTVRDALDGLKFNYNVNVISDAVASVTPEFCAEALYWMQTEGAKILTSEDVLAMECSNDPISLSSLIVMICLIFVIASFIFYHCRRAGNDDQQYPHIELGLKEEPSVDCNYRSTKEVSVEPSNACQSQITEGHLCMVIVTLGLCIGTPVIPWIFAGASLVPSLATLILMFVFTVWTSELVIDFANERQEFNLLTLIPPSDIKYKDILTKVIDCYIYIVVFLLLVGCNTTISTNIVALPEKECFPYWATCFFVVAVLLSLRGLEHGKIFYLCCLSLMSFAFVFGRILWHNFSDESTERQQICILGIGKGTATMLGGIANIAVIQVIVLPLCRRMEKQSPKQTKRVVRKGFGIVLLLLGCFGVTAYWVYGEKVQDVVTITSAGSWEKVALSLALVCGSPLLRCRATDLRNNWHEFIFVLASGLCSILLRDRLGVLVNISGAVHSLVVCCAIPAIFMYGIRCECTVIGAVFVLSLILFFIGLPWSGNYVEKLTCFF